MAARALARAFLDEDATRLHELALRFAAPVFPGDALRVALWLDGATARRCDSVQACLRAAAWSCSTRGWRRPADRPRGHRPFHSLKPVVDSAAGSG